MNAWSSSRKLARRPRQLTRQLVIDHLEERTLMAAHLLDSVDFGPASGGYDSARIAHDVAGNTYLAATRLNETGPLDLDPFAIHAGDTDIVHGSFIARFNPAGQFEWAREITNDAGGFYLGDIELGPSGNVYFSAVVTSSNATIGPYVLPNASSYGTRAAGSLDVAGNVLWARTIGTAKNEYGGSTLAVDELRHRVYVAGVANSSNLVRTEFSQIVALDTSQSAVPVAWSRDFTGDRHRVGDVTADPAGNVIATGWLAGKVDFDPGPGKALLSPQGRNSSAAFVTKLNVDGNFVWAKAFTSSNGGAAGASVISDSAGNLYIGGTFVGDVDFDPGSKTVRLTNWGGSDLFLVKLNSAGNYLGGASFGTASDDHFTAMDRGPTGDIYLAEFTHNPDGTQTAYLVQFNSNVQFVAAQTLTSTGGLYIFDLAVSTTQPGKVDVIGLFSGNVDLDGDGLTDLATDPGASDLFWAIYG